MMSIRCSMRFTVGADKLRARCTRWTLVGVDRLLDYMGNSKCLKEV